MNSRVFIHQVLHGCTSTLKIRIFKTPRDWEFLLHLNDLIFLFLLNIFLSQPSPLLFFVPFSRLDTCCIFLLRDFRDLVFGISSRSPIRLSMSLSPRKECQVRRLYPCCQQSNTSIIWDPSWCLFRISWRKRSLPVVLRNSFDLLNYIQWRLVIRRFFSSSVNIRPANFGTENEVRRWARGRLRMCNFWVSTSLSRL